jgi:hypothetical protein
VWEAAGGKYKHRDPAAIAVPVGACSSVTGFLQADAFRNNPYAVAGKAGIDFGTPLTAGLITAFAPDDFLP